MKQLLQFILFIIPLFTIGQTKEQAIPIFGYVQVFQDSTTNRIQTPGYKNMMSYQHGLSIIYFTSLQQTDSALRDSRLLYAMLRDKNKFLFLNQRKRFFQEYEIDSTGVTYYFPAKGRSTGIQFDYFRTQNTFASVPVTSENINSSAPALITVHGNAYYEFSYRSRIDTPFLANDFQQHVEQIYADLVYKEKYPFRISLTAKQSNSPFFRDHIDGNIQFDQFHYRETIKNSVFDDLKNRLNEDRSDILRNALTRQKYLHDSLMRWINHPARTQEIVEEKEKRLVEYYQLEAEKKRTEKLMGALSATNGEVWKDVLKTEDNELIKKICSAALDSLEKKRDIYIRNQEKISLEKDSLRRSLMDSSLAPNAILTNARRKKDTIQRKVDSLSTALGQQKSKLDTVQLAIDCLLALQRNWKERVLDSLQKIVFKKDSSLKSLMNGRTAAEERIEKSKKILEEINNNIQKLKAGADSAQTKYATKLADIRNKLGKARSPAEINTIIKSENGKALDKKSQLMLSTKQLGIGTSVLNYSELTVKNISLTGVNVEYQNRLYSAFAIGQVDYRFRDFIINPTDKGKQNLVLARYGWLPGKNKSIIVTAYKGTKQNYNNDTAAQITNGTVATHILGYGIELNYKINSNTEFTGEVAKSSAPYRGGGSTYAMNKAFAFSDHTNEAWSLKMNGVVPVLGTTLRGFYKKVGINFQSYSIFNSGSRQESWGVVLQQSLWHKQVSITGQIKRNDFDNPLISRGYSTNATLKSIQGVFRKRRWPLISLAYMPTTQLSKLSDGSMIENIFYSFSALAAQSYKTKKGIMNTTFFYNAFNSQGTDTGFVFFRAKSARLNHDIEMRKISSHSAIDVYTQPELTFYTLSQSVDYRVSTQFNFGIGVKRAILKNGDGYFGGSAQVALNIKSLASFQMQYEKGFLPDYRGSALTTANWGRLVCIKTF